jgi:4-amino-4-deoxy-L-arabinose transferase-like glycosyltransferase
MRPPLYPAFLASIWWWTGTSEYQIVRLLQIIIAAASTWLLYRLGSVLYRPTVGAIAAVGYWLYPSFIATNHLILTETLFTTLLLGFILLTVETARSGRVSIAFASGATLALTALTRSILWPLPVVLTPVLLLVVPGRRRAAVVTACMWLGYLAVIAPWAARNTNLQGKFTVVDTMGGINLRIGNYEHTPDERMWAAVGLEGEKNWSHALRQEFPGQRFTEGEKSQWAQAEALRHMAAHPVQTLRRSAIRFADFWGLEREFVAGIRWGYYAPPDWFAALAAVAITVSYVVVAVLGAAGVFLARPDWRAHLIVLLPALAIMGGHMLVFAHSRYHLPVVPLLILYGTALVMGTPKASFSWRRPAAAGAALAVLLLLAVWIRQVMFVDAGLILQMLRG